LKENGHEVTVFTTDGFKKRLDVKNDQSVFVDGIEVYYFRNISMYMSGKLNMPFPLFSINKIRKKIKNFDIVHIHEYRHFLGSVTSYFANKNNVPYILQPRASLQRVDKSKIKRIYDLCVGYNLIKNSNTLLLSSKNEYNIAKDLINKFSSEVTLKYIPNGINLEEVKTDTPSRIFKEKFNIKQETKVILYLGRLHKRKGIDNLIKAIEKLKEKNHQLKLLIVGPDDGYRKHLENLVKSKNLREHVIFTGGLYSSLKYSAYSAADVFVLPSLDEQESFGNVVLEASAFRTPCVVTNVCGVSEWMENIIKVDPDIESLSNGIEKGLNSKKLGEEAREEVIRKFTWDAIVENKLIPIYEKILE